MENRLPLDIEEPQAIERPEETQVFVAPQWKLIWWKFKKHRMAVIGAIITILIYVVALFVEFLAPFDPHATNSDYTYAPPQQLILIDNEDGFALRPYVHGYKAERHPVTFRLEFTIDETQKTYLQFFAKGEPYKLLGIFDTDIHLFGPVDPEKPVYLIGADRLGRDMFSRILYGARISMSIGLVGVFVSLILGILLGGISGYYGGMIDNIIQRIIEFLRSIPTIPLWLGLSAALPLNWPPLQVYFAITIILALRGWTGMARVVRGRFLSLRTEDFVMAAKLDGESEISIILRQMLPAFASHIIASITLSIPGMILGETALSFLGLGLRPPIVSWGVLLQEAQNVQTVATAPWLLLPAGAVVLAVLALNFFGDGLRDAADPYT